MVYMMNAYPPAPTSDLVVIYDGSALSAHAMDVRDLGPALTAMGDMFERANVLLNGKSVAVDIKMQAIRPGSYQIIAELATIGGAAVVSAASIGQVVISYITMKKMLKGHTPDIVENSTGMVRIRANGFELNVPDGRFSADEIRSLLPDRIMSRSVSGVLAPLKKEGIELVSFHGENADETVTKDDIFSFDFSPENIIISQEIHPSLKLEIISPNLKDYHAKWRFSDGRKIHSYAVSDMEFINDVMSKRRGFTAGDILVCDVQITKFLTRNGSTKIEYNILKVHE